MCYKRFDCFLLSTGWPRVTVRKILALCATTTEPISIKEKRVIVGKKEAKRCGKRITRSSRSQKMQKGRMLKANVSLLSRKIQ